MTAPGVRDVEQVMGASAAERERDEAKKLSSMQRDDIERCERQMGLLEVRAMTAERERDHNLAGWNRTGDCLSAITTALGVKCEKAGEENSLASVAVRRINELKSAEAKVAQLTNRLDTDSQNFQIECQKAEIQLLRARLAEAEDRAASYQRSAEEFALQLARAEAVARAAEELRSANDDLKTIMLGSGQEECARKMLRYQSAFDALRPALDAWRQDAEEQS